jgi:hypothetical protein
VNKLINNNLTACFGLMAKIGTEIANDQYSNKNTDKSGTFAT